MAKILRKKWDFGSDFQTLRYKKSEVFLVGIRKDNFYNTISEIQKMAFFAGWNSNAKDLLINEYSRVSSNHTASIKRT